MGEINDFDLLEICFIFKDILGVYKDYFQCIIVF